MKPLICQEHSYRQMMFISLLRARPGPTASSVLVPLRLRATYDKSPLGAPVFCFHIRFERALFSLAIFHVQEIRETLIMVR